MVVTREGYFAKVMPPLLSTVAVEKMHQSGPYVDDPTLSLGVCAWSASPCVAGRALGSLESVPRWAPCGEHRTPTSAPNRGSPTVRK